MDALLLMAALALTGTPTVPPAHSHKHDTKSSRAVKTHHRLHREESCATCVGNVPCGACHTCELCKHCNEGKGSCGVCEIPHKNAEKMTVAEIVHSTPKFFRERNCFRLGI